MSQGRNLQKRSLGRSAVDGQQEAYTEVAHIKEGGGNKGMRCRKLVEDGGAEQQGPWVIGRGKQGWGMVVTGVGRLGQNDTTQSKALSLTVEIRSSAGT
jgi:hypothetical protein